MARQLETGDWVPYPVELVFAFFANPTNLPHLMLPETEARVEDVRLQPPPPRPFAADPARRFKSVAAGEGSEILISFYAIKWLPKRISWTARIVEFAWNSHFIDEQVRGPFAKFRHRHGIATEARGGIEGTRVTDSIEYALPGGTLADFAAGAVLRQLTKSFEYRRRKLPEILAVAARQAAQKA